MLKQQMEIYQELKRQGMEETGSKFIARRFKNQEQEHIMMKYLNSIQNKEVTQTEVALTSIAITQM